jgi:hypothetical protein
MTPAPCNACGLPPVYRHSITGLPQVTLEHACGGVRVIITNSHDDPAVSEANMGREWNEFIGRAE